jgi:hypothetical protein
MANTSQQVRAGSMPLGGALCRSRGAGIFLAAALLIVAPARAGDSPSGSGYGTNGYGSGPRGPATENVDRHNNRYAPQGSIPLPAPRKATSATLRVKVEPPGATVVFHDMRGAIDFGEVATATGLASQIQVPISNSRVCMSSTDAGVIEVELLRWSSRR